MVGDLRCDSVACQTQSCDGEGVRREARWMFHLPGSQRSSGQSGLAWEQSLEGGTRSGRPSVHSHLVGEDCTLRVSCHVLALSQSGFQGLATNSVNLEGTNCKIITRPKNILYYVGP